MNEPVQVPVRLLSEVLHAIGQNLSLTQTSMARQIGVPESTLARYLSPSSPYDCPNKNNWQPHQASDTIKKIMDWARKACTQLPITGERERTLADLNAAYRYAYLDDERVVGLQGQEAKSTAATTTELIGNGRLACSLLDDRVVVYQTQEEAYRRLGPFIEKHHVRSAVLVQFSGSSVFGLLSTLLSRVDNEDSGTAKQTPVVLYTAHRDVAKSLGSEQQFDNIKAVAYNRIFDILEPERRRHLDIRTYRTPGSISGLHIDFVDDEPLLLLGYMTYEQTHNDSNAPGDRKNLHGNQYGDDYLQLSAHDRATIMARGGTQVYDLLLPTFADTVRNLEVVSLPKDMSWCPIDMSPATVAFFRLRSLLPSDDQSEMEFNELESTRLGVWAGEDLMRVAYLVEGTRSYYDQEPGENARIVAHYDLLLGWTYREIWVGQESQEHLADDTYLAKAKASLQKALDYWENPRNGRGFLGQAYCQDRLGTIEHIQGDFQGAQQHYDRASTLAARDDSLPALKLRSWIRLNRSLLAFDKDDYGSARELLRSSFEGFERHHDRFGLLSCIAAAVSLAAVANAHKLALRFFGALPAERTGTIGPTYWRWVSKASESCRRELGDRVADEVCTTGASARFEDIINDVQQFLSDSPGDIRQVALDGDPKPGAGSEASAISREPLTNDGSSPLESFIKRSIEIQSDIGDGER